MDVQLLLAFIFSVVLVPSLVMGLLFKRNRKTIYKIHFFDNLKYQKLTYFMYMILALGVLLIFLVRSGNQELLIHIFISSLLILVFRKGIN